MATQTPEPRGAIHYVCIKPRLPITPGPMPDEVQEHTMWLVRRLEAHIHDVTPVFRAACLCIAIKMYSRDVDFVYCMSRLGMKMREVVAAEREVLRLLEWRVARLPPPEPEKTPKDPPPATEKVPSIPTPAPAITRLTPRLLHPADLKRKSVIRQLRLLDASRRSLCRYARLQRSRLADPV